MEIKTELELFQDYTAPLLDIYEQAIYLYILRHSRLQEKEEITIGFKSVRLQMAFGIGEKGKPMSESVCYGRLLSLEQKGFIKKLGTEYSGTKLSLFLPSEIPNLIPVEKEIETFNLEEVDFYNIHENRRAILIREKSKCFYCFSVLTESNYVIEHVLSRPNGNNTFRNLVASCVSCNNQKGNQLVEDFLRGLFRKNFLSSEELENRMNQLQLLRNGELKPIIIS